jgi:TnpA family transposase
LFSIEKPGSYPGLDGTVAGTLNTKQIVAQWDDILRLAASIEQGTASASRKLRKLGAAMKHAALDKVSGIRRHNLAPHPQRID